MSTHSGTVCDCCGRDPIIGTRFKCLQCPDFDLCETCINNNSRPVEAHVNAHFFIHMKQPMHSSWLDSGIFPSTFLLKVDFSKPAPPDLNEYLSEVHRHPDALSAKWERAVQQAPISTVMSRQQQQPSTQGPVSLPHPHPPMSGDCGVGLTQGIQAFGMNVFVGLCQEEKFGENVFCSPLSIAVALAMLIPGATGTALQELKRCFGTSACFPELGKGFQAVFRAMHSTDPQVKIVTANSAWQSLVVNPTYINQTQEYFNAEIQALPKTPQPINDWVAKKTGNLINHVLDEVDPSLILLLLNTIYFKGTWQFPFDPQKTKLRPFHARSGKVSQVPTMEITRGLPYGENSSFQIVSLPYGKTGQFSMALLLPKQQDVVSLLTKFAAEPHEAFLKCLRTLKPYAKGTLRVPKLALEYGVKDMETCCRALGLNSMWEEGGLEEISRGAFVSFVLHKAVMKMDEEGTVAAAVTAVGVARNCLPKAEPRPWLMECDRPFLLFIYHNSSSLPVFQGCVVAC